MTMNLLHNTLRSRKLPWSSILQELRSADYLEFSNLIEPLTKKLRKLADIGR